MILGGFKTPACLRLTYFESTITYFKFVLYHRVQKYFSIFKTAVSNVVAGREVYILPTHIQNILK